MKILTVLLLVLPAVVALSQEKRRAREYGIAIGVLSPGKTNSIVDVAGVKVGHTTIIEGPSVRTGVTAIVPHSGNIFQEKVPAAIYVGNGFGKLAGITQVNELGNTETPIILTNTLSVSTAMEAVIEHTLTQPGNEDVRSVNAVVGETNDGWLNDIRGRHVRKEHVLNAIRSATTDKVKEGNVGAGTGTVCFGFKGGIGSASRVLPKSAGSYTVGVLVQTNFGGVLQIDGVPIGEMMGKHFMSEQLKDTADGSCMIVVATDAPVDYRNLERIAKRAMLGLAKTGGIASNGSGDYVIAFSTDPSLRIPFRTDSKTKQAAILLNDEMSPLFLAVIEATEEAIINSLFMADRMKGRDNHEVEPIPIEEVMKLMRKSGATK